MRIRFGAVILSILCTVTLFTVPAGWRHGAAAQQPPAYDGKISPYDLEAFRTVVAAPKKDSASSAPVVKAGATTYTAWSAEFESEEKRKNINVPGVHLFARFDRWADMFIPAQDEETLKKVIESGVVRMDMQRRVTIPPIPGRISRVPTRGKPDPIVQNGREVRGKRLTGKGVIIVIVDTGVDFRNPDFITKDTDGKPVSRMLYLWDTVTNVFEEKKIGSMAPVTYPNGQSFGTLYTREQLSEELRSDAKTIPDTDTGGHGTACAGVAAGNGRNSGTDPRTQAEYSGVAPEAELIGVRIGAGQSVSNTFLLNAIVEWVDSIAGDRPVVISCSFGQMIGPRDGSTVAERHLSARFADNVKGRAICIAAGNYGADRNHAEVIMGTAAAPAVVEWYTASPANLQIYCGDIDSDDLTITVANGTKADMYGRDRSPFTRENVRLFAVGPGAGKLLISSKSGKKNTINCYLLGARGDNKNAGGFSKACVSYNKTLTQPSTAENALCIASYDWNDNFNMEGKLQTLTSVVLDPNAPEKGYPNLRIGDLSLYSSRGPCRNPAFPKPDLAAPGQFYAASAPLNKVQDEDKGEIVRDTSGKYQLFNGTSAATPYTAGIIALMFEKDPSLTAGKVRDLLRQNVQRDRFTGGKKGDYSPEWGFGKLNVKAVDEILERL
jgi:subtilisin family serine protease